MLIFDYGGVHNAMDRGQWAVTIHAPNREIADQHFTTHVASKGWPELKPADYFLQSRMRGQDCILYTDLEEKVHGEEETEGGI